jgi:hypothetical protein
VTSEDEPVRLTIVPNEPLAEMLCSMLRSSDIKAMQRITNVAFGGGGELPSSGMGPREILVLPADLERARDLIADQQSER